MNEGKINFKNKKILIYGFGKSGISCFNFLKGNNTCKIYDDNTKNIPTRFKKKLINIKKLLNISFDFIVLSPGIDINKCRISAYLSRNRPKIITELDIFEISYPKINKITITGTNGKSTTSKLLHDLLKNNKMDVRLTGNIGYPILMEKKIKKNTIFVIEASSYQLDYSQYFKSKYSVILNLNPDHLERHGTFKNYVNAKFKIVKLQTKNDYTFIDSKNKILNELVKKQKIKSKVIKIDYFKYKKYFRLIDNIYFKNSSNRKNLSFIFNIAKVLKINFKTVINTANKFKGLDFRQQIIYQSRKLLIINDSKSTSFSSSIDLLNNIDRIFWILGGLPKKGDKLKLENKNNIQKIYIYGQNSNVFAKFFKKKIKYSKFPNLEHAMKQISSDIKKGEKNKKINLIFSPCAASFDNFKNFEERGKYFNYLITRYKVKNAKQ